MKVYFVRHGQTDWNIQHKIQGWTDIPLNAEGIRQAYETKERLKDVPFDAVYSSSLCRAAKTAEIITEGRGLTLRVDDRIKERFFGEYEEKPWDESTFNKTWLAEPEGTYERLDHFNKRVADFLDDLKEKRPGETVLVVSHGGTMRAVENYFSDSGEECLGITDNGGYRVYEL